VPTLGQARRRTLEGEADNPSRHPPRLHHAPSVQGDALPSLKPSYISWAPADVGSARALANDHTFDAIAFGLEHDVVRPVVTLSLTSSVTTCSSSLRRTQRTSKCDSLPMLSVRSSGARAPMAVELATQSTRYGATSPSPTGISANGVLRLITTSNLPVCSHRALSAVASDLQGRHPTRATGRVIGDLRQHACASTKRVGPR
jgi:hypothetical protein